MNSEIIPKNTISFILRISPEIHQDLRKVSFLKKISMQSFVMECIKKKLEEEKDELERKN